MFFSHFIMLVCWIALFIIFYCLMFLILVTTHFRLYFMFLNITFTTSPQKCLTRSVNELHVLKAPLNSSFRSGPIAIVGTHDSISCKQTIIRSRFKRHFSDVFFPAWSPPHHSSPGTLRNAVVRCYYKFNTSVPLALFWHTIAPEREIRPVGPSTGVGPGKPEEMSRRRNKAEKDILIRSIVWTELIDFRWWGAWFF